MAKGKYIDEHHCKYIVRKDKYIEFEESRFYYYHEDMYWVITQLENLYDILELNLCPTYHFKTGINTWWKEEWYEDYLSEMESDLRKKGVNQKGIDYVINLYLKRMRKRLANEEVAKW